MRVLILILVSLTMFSCGKASKVATVPSDAVVITAEECPQFIKDSTLRGDLDYIQDVARHDDEELIIDDIRYWTTIECNAMIIAYPN